MAGVTWSSEVIVAIIAAKIVKEFMEMVSMVFLPCWHLFLSIAIHRKLHTVLRRLAVQKRTVFGDAPCLKLSVYRYK